jgi:hypothetical protein
MESPVPLWNIRGSGKTVLQGDQVETYRGWGSVSLLFLPLLAWHGCSYSIVVPLLSTGVPLLCWLVTMYWYGSGEYDT